MNNYEFNNNNNEYPLPSLNELNNNQLGPQDNYSHHQGLIYDNDNSNENNNDYNNNNYNIEMQNRYPGLNPENKLTEGEGHEMSEEEQRIQKMLRIGFIRKVYGILTVQLILTFGFVLFCQKDSIKNFVNNHSFLGVLIILVPSILFIVVFVLMIANEDLAKKVPYNYILLFVLTIGEALFCAYAALEVSYDSVVLALILTIVSSAAITVYTFNIKEDWTNVGGLLYVVFAQIFSFSILGFILNISFLQMFCCLLGTLILGIYLVFDTQLIIGKFGNALSIDDYIFAALELYLDIVRIFLEIIKVIILTSKK